MQAHVSKVLAVILEKSNKDLLSLNLIHSIPLLPSARGGSVNGSYVFGANLRVIKHLCRLQEEQTCSMSERSISNRLPIVSAYVEQVVIRFMWVPR